MCVYISLLSLNILSIYSLLDPCSIVHRIYPIIEKHSAAPCTQINTLSRIEHCTVGRDSPSIYYSQGRQPNILSSSFPLLYHCMAASEQTLNKANFNYVNSYCTLIVQLPSKLSLSKSAFGKDRYKQGLNWANLKLKLGFTLNKVCCIILMITNYHYISLSTISL